MKSGESLKTILVGSGDTAGFCVGLPAWAQNRCPQLPLRPAGRRPAACPGAREWMFPLNAKAAAPPSTDDLGQGRPPAVRRPGPSTMVVPADATKGCGPWADAVNQAGQKPRRHQLCMGPLVTGFL